MLASNTALTSIDNNLTYLIALKQAMASFGCLLFLTTNKIGTLNGRIDSLVDLAVHIDHFDDARRSRVWDMLETKFQREYETLVLTRNARDLLHSPETQIDWNGHEMNRCFKTAIALAAAPANQEKSIEKGTITIDDEHFKEAMNTAHEFRLYLKSLRGSEAEHAQRQQHRNDNFDPTGATLRQQHDRPREFIYSDDDSTEMEGSETDTGDRTRPRPRSRVQEKKPPISGFRHREDSTKRYSNRPGDPSLCIPDLNCVEWEGFQEAGSDKELFRKTKFYAVDVLVGEPRIKLKPNRKVRQRPSIKPQGGAATSAAMHQVVPEQQPNPGPSEPGEDPLPERIRINSPTVLKAFSEIIEEALPSSVLLFRPFVALIYYEQEFRNWASQQEDIVEGRLTSEVANFASLLANSLSKGNSTVPTEAGTDDDSPQPDTKIKHALSGLQDMRCLLSFIDNYIKKKQAYLSSDRCVSVAFSDLALLFNPGDLVIGDNLRQAYRVTRVTTEPHKAKTRDGKDLEFWKDETEAKFEEAPVFVHYIHVDFDGTMIGPVSHVSAFLRFQGKMDVRSLPIYPLRHSKDRGLREKLVSRGKMFLKVASIKHMHYTGLTLETRDDIDSQVVIDFGEAFVRFPNWTPIIRNATDEWLLRRASDYKPNFRSDSPEDEWIPHYQKALKLRNVSCIPECCSDDWVHVDEHAEIERMKDYFVEQMKEATPAAPSVGIIPTAFKDINDRATLTDDDFLIMSFRVFGFVLRNRKWRMYL